MDNRITAENRRIDALTIERLSFADIPILSQGGCPGKPGGLMIVQEGY
tara:strand:- start:89 stop:232 length:144 start_codon:yes stop_codon:yes gene_type:complete